MTHISTFGQMNIDILFGEFGSLPKLGEEVFANGFDIQLGGGPMVYAILLERLGVKTKLGTFLSNDRTSDLAIKLLDEIGFNNYTNFYNKKDGRPVVVTSVLSFSEDRSFICYNENMRETMLKDQEVYDFLKGSKVVFAPHGKEEVLKKLYEDGTKIIFDTGWYDNLHIDMYKETLKYVEVFTPNDKEAKKMTGKDNVEEAVKELAKYVKHPIVSIGNEGCMTYNEGKIITVKMPIDFDAIDTTGAGDNFLAGIMYGLFHDWDIIECMKMGNVLGGYSTTALGCYKADVNLQTALELMNKYD